MNCRRSCLSTFLSEVAFCEVLKLLSEVVTKCCAAKIVSPCFSQKLQSCEVNKLFSEVATVCCVAEVFCCRVCFRCFPEAALCEIRCCFHKLQPCVA